MLKKVSNYPWCISIFVNGGPILKNELENYQNIQTTGQRNRKMIFQCTGIIIKNWTLINKRKTKDKSTYSLTIILLYDITYLKIVFSQEIHTFK